MIQCDTSLHARSTFPNIHSDVPRKYILTRYFSQKADGEIKVTLILRQPSVLHFHNIRLPYFEICFQLCVSVVFAVIRTFFFDIFLVLSLRALPMPS